MITCHRLRNGLYRREEAGLQMQARRCREMEYKG